MTSTLPPPNCASPLAPPTRNRYFYAQELSVHHFELETEYHSYKRRLLNRLVTGHGVVCGLNVTRHDDCENRGLLVSAGVAIDGHGREIIVSEARPFFDGRLNGATPANGKKGDAEQDHCEKEEFHLVLCYHECEWARAPARASACGTDECIPDTIVERFCLELREGEVPDDIRPAGLCMPDCVGETEIDYDALVKYVSSCCPDCPCDPCIPLAEIDVPEDPDEKLGIDIFVRPIVFSNDLLYQLFLCQLAAPKGRRSK